jgi:hypothetical protein
MDIDGPSRHIELHAGGTLAAQPGGVCLRELLQRHIAAIEPTIDPAITDAVRYATIQVP